MKKKGFTLIELLAVILILGIIAVIAIPRVAAIITESKKNSFKLTAENITDAAEYSWNDNNLAEAYYYVEGEKYTTSSENLQFKGKIPEVGIVDVTDDGSVAVALFDGEYCATKSGDSDTVTIENKTVEECNTYNVVSTKDTWTEIATKNNIILEDLLEINNESDLNSPTAGRIIKIPVIPISDPSLIDGVNLIYKDRDDIYTYTSATTKLDVDDNDDGTAAIDLGFNFNFGGTTYTTIYPSTNGYITFNEDDAYEYDNTSLTSWFAYPIIAAYWTDLYFDFDIMPDSGIYYTIGNENGKNYILVEWRDVTDLNSDNQDATTTGNFEIKLYENGNIRFYYQDVEFEGVDYSNGIDATIGVFANGNNYVQHSYMEASVANEEALEFYLTIGTIEQFDSQCFSMNESTGTITGYNNSNPACSSDLVIPEKINNITVTSIGDSAFQYDSLTSVVFPNTVTTIGSSAFNGNQISSVTFGSGIESIGPNAFYNNQLESITINSTNTVIGELIVNTNSFKAAYEIYGTGLYYGTQNGLWHKDGEEPVIPITPEYCFSFDSATKTLTGYMNAAGCGMDLNIPSTIGGVTVENIGIPFNNYGFTSLILPNTIKFIGSYSFSNNNLTTLVIPASVETIGYYAFYNNNLTSVDLSSATSLETIDYGAFQSNKLTALTIPSSVKSLGVKVLNDNLFSDATAFIYARNVDGSINNTRLISYAGAKKSDVVIPNNVTTIGKYSFETTNLSSITLPNALTSIEEYAFLDNDLIGITLPSTLTSIDYGAFENNKLTNVTIPSSVKFLGIAVFNNNFFDDSHAFIYARYSNGTINTSTIISYAGENRTNVVIPSGVTTLSDFSFMQLGLLSVTIPNTVTYIGDIAFMQNLLTTITIPSSVNTIDWSVFQNNQLTSITMGKAGTVIGDNMLTSFDNNFRTTYYAGGAGTYVGTQAGTWTKQ